MADAGKSGAERQFASYSALAGSSRRFPAWYMGHGSLCNVVRELANGREDAKVALPLLRAYFEDLSALGCGAYPVDAGPGILRVAYRSTLRKEYEKGAPSLDKHFSGVYKEQGWQGESWCHDYEERTLFSITSFGEIGGGTVALLLISEVNSAITKLGPPPAPLVRGLLTHTHPALRANAARCVPALEMPDAQVSADLTPLLRDADLHVRFQAALAAVNTAAIDGALAAIGDGLKDADKQAVNRRVEQAVPALVAVVLKQTDWQRRAKAVEQLGQIGPRANRAASVLTALQNDPSVELRQAAFDALNKINPPK